jgi:hypothetical protein
VQETIQIKNIGNFLAKSNKEVEGLGLRAWGKGPRAKQ